MALICLNISLTSLGLNFIRNGGQTHLSSICLPAIKWALRWRTDYEVLSTRGSHPMIHRDELALL